MGELVPINNLDISNLEDQDIDILYQQIMQRKFNNMLARQEQLEHRMLRFEEEVNIKQTELENKFEDLQADNERKLEVVINTYRVDKNKWGYESQADFGNRFRVSIGSGTVGKLFKSIGLAKNSKGNTEPYRHNIPKYATTEIVKGYPTFRWHHENCLNFLENWLNDNELLEEFYSISTEKEMKKFIDSLYNQYVD